MLVFGVVTSQAVVPRAGTPKIQLKHQYECDFTSFIHVLLREIYEALLLVLLRRIMAC